MTSLSITRAWNETIAFMKRESGLVLPIAFLLIALPGAALQLLTPAADAPPPASFEAVMDQMRPFFMALPVIIILSGIGGIAISYLAIFPGVSVREALVVGLRRFIFPLLAALILGLAGAVLILPFFLFIGVAPGAGSAALMILVGLAYALLCIALAVRLILMNPVAAAERIGPIGLITRSWELTKGHFWKLLGFIILFCIVAFVIMLVISIFLGLIVVLALGPPLPGTTSGFVTALLSAIVQAVMSTYFVTAVARIYAQLAGTDAGEIFA